MFAKIFKGALIAAAGAILTYGTDQIPNIHIRPDLLPIVTAGWAIVVNAIRHAIGSTKP